MTVLMSKLGKYEKLGLELGRLVQEKNLAYGDSFSRACEVLVVLYPEGIKPEHYSDFLTVVRVIDKLFRVATDKDAFGEDPWRDICGYAMLAAAKREK